MSDPQTITNSCTLRLTDAGTLEQETSPDVLQPNEGIELTIQRHSLGSLYFLQSRDYKGLFVAGHSLGEVLAQVEPAIIDLQAAIACVGETVMKTPATYPETEAAIRADERARVLAEASKKIAALTIDPSIASPVPVGFYKALTRSLIALHYMRFEKPTR